MKKLKTVIRAVLSLALLSCLALGVTACKADKKPANISGEWVITLEEAYKKKLLSKSDLREISEKFSGHESEDNPEEKLILEYGAERIEAVKKAEAGNINNYQSLKIKIIGYYGTYGRCVIVETDMPTSLEQMIHTIYVGGVKFSYANTFVKVWVKD